MKDKMDGVSLKKRTRVILFGGVFFDDNCEKEHDKDGNSDEDSALLVRTPNRVLKSTKSGPK